MEDSDFLARVPIFDGLTEQQLWKVSEILERRCAEQGELIIREGEMGNTMYVLTAGTVEVSKTLTLWLPEKDFGEREKSLSRLSANECAFFGEMALLENSERSATVTAVHACEMLEIRKAEFERFCDENPEIGYLIVRNIAKLLSSRLRQTNKDILKLATALSLALSKK